MSRKRLGVVLGTWDIVWKIVALRKAVRNRQYRWIIPLLLTSSAGILPMLYIWRFSERPTAADASASGVTPVA